MFWPIKAPKQTKEEIHIKVRKEDKNLNKITNKELYWILVKKIQKEPIFQEKLQQELKIEKEEWGIFFMIPKNIRQTKIQVFQYKLLFSLEPCNLYLHRIKRSETNKCKECQKLDDTAHYMFECPQVVPFWNNFMDWWNALTNGATFLDKRSAFTGFVGPSREFQTLNVCLLFAKWHVYKRKLNESEIFFYNFLCDLRYHLEVEKTIAIRNDMLDKYNNKWQVVEDYIT
jgi:hypothetical protein